MKAGTRQYLSDSWNVLDIVNLSLFVYSILSRMNVLYRCLPLLREIEVISARADPWDDNMESDPAGNHGNFVAMHDVAQHFQIITFLNAFNSILTWIKLFKFLNYFPDMRILTTTLKIAGKPRRLPPPSTAPLPLPFPLPFH